MRQVKKQVRRKPGKSGYRKVNDWLHLWLGLAAGIVIVIVGLTGCIYAFEKEIRNVSEPYQFVQPQKTAFLLPSQIKQAAAKAVFGNAHDSSLAKIMGVSYGTADKAATAAYTDKRNGYTVLYINPYDGKLLHTKIFKKDFFRIILMGHYYLWLPPAVGQPIVASAVLIFVVLLITGMVMWWPKNLKKANLDKSFKIKWKASFKRVNYDLHNVPGFYISIFAFAIAVTGLVWGFKWFSSSYYWTISGGKSFVQLKQPLSDTTKMSAAVLSPEDKVWLQMSREYPEGKGSIQIQSPIKKSDAIRVFYNPDEDTHYRREFRYFDRYTLAEIKGTGVYATKYADA
ncbi:MAG: PepSY domain-containing protein, partial [Bacteroidetes bacterium]|nr:PepSY domain-containing protein [Bacteroidota bacterium]